jgi:hypothetical protein
MKRLVLTLAVAVLAVTALAQVDTAWVRLYKCIPTAWSGAFDIALDDAGNAYVTGTSCGSTGVEDYATIKYTPAGDTLWARRYDGTGAAEDEAYAMALDGQGNVYVTGGSAAPGGYWDCVTIKYGPNGEQRWVARYDGPGHEDDWANDIAVDELGGVYVTGTSVGAGADLDIVTIKYDTDGAEQWVARHAGALGIEDEANAIAVDDSGGIYVTGVEDRGLRPDTESRMVTIKYGPTGDTVWVNRYAGPGDGLDEGYAIAVDRVHHVYVTGMSKDSVALCTTIKYAPGGATRWVGTYAGSYPYLDQFGSALALDGQGNVYVGGRCAVSGQFNDYLTIKYNATGDTLWVRTYNGPTGYSSDWVNDIALDAAGNVYVTGMSEQIHPYGEDDYATIKYSASGEQQWIALYNHPTNGDDQAYAVAVDDAGHVCVTGISGNDSYCTIKYNQAGGVEEGSTKPSAGCSKYGPSVVRGVLRVPPRDMTEMPGISDRVPRPVLIDAAGRKVMDLTPGACDVSRLAPGVYFVRGKGQETRGVGPSERVVIAK